MTSQFSSSIFGSYRINTTYFPSPESQWDEQSIAPGLNGIPINSSYKIHTWNFDKLDATLAELLYALWQSQQDDNTQLNTLETDPYDATGGNLKYGTTEYSDFVIQTIGNRHRGFPNYEGVSVIFEVYVA